MKSLFSKVWNTMPRGLILFLGVFTCYCMLVSLLLWTESQNQGALADRRAVKHAVEQIKPLLENRLSHWIEMTKTLGAGSHSWFRTMGLQNEYLKTVLESTDDVMSVAAFVRTSGQWADRFRLIRRENDPYRLVRPYFLGLNETAPIPFEKVKSHGVTLVSGSVKLSEPTEIIRLAVPARGFGEEVWVSEIAAQTVVQMLEDLEGALGVDEVFLVNQDDEAVISLSSNFHTGERVQHLPIVTLARASSDASGALTYHPYPSQPKVSGAYLRLENVPSLLLVVQKPLRAAAFFSSSVKNHPWSVALYLICGLILSATLSTAIRTRLQNARIAPVKKQEYSEPRLAA